MTNPRRSERLDVEVGRYPLAPLRLSPFDRHCRNTPSPLHATAVIQDTSRAECSDCTFVQLCLLRTHDEEARFTRLSQVARPVARLKLSGCVRAPPRPSRDGHENCCSNNRDASSTKPMVPCDIAGDDRDKADGDQRGGYEAAPPSFHPLSIDSFHNFTLCLRLPAKLSPNLRHLCLRLLQLVRHPHLAVHRRRGGEVLLR